MEKGKFHPHTKYEKGTRMSRDQSTKTEGVKIRKERLWSGSTGFCPVCNSEITRDTQQEVKQHIKDHLEMDAHSHHSGVCDCGGNYVGVRKARLENSVRKARLENVISDEEAKEIRKGYFKEGVSKEDDRKFTDWQKSKASDLYQIYVEKFPNSQIAEEYRRGSLGHGHFGEALFEGRYADAMYRADSKNLVMLHDIGLEHFLSKVQRHPSDPSEYDTFIGRYEWAKDYRGE
ncbi:MAG: hypothetical protein KJI69_03775 [Patescibacteria group bacterium]|nr:hypothetical protein [Patescibacteria group bacterium]